MNPGPATRQPAQILAFFAIALLAIVPMLGVVLDGGTLFLERRTAQDAADAAALAGTRVLAKATSSTALTGFSDEISTYVNLHDLRRDAVVECAYFVASDGVTPAGNIANPSGGCSSTPTGATTAAVACTSPSSASIPCSATGVHVDTRIGPFNTYLLGMVGTSTSTVMAHASSQVGLVTATDGGNAPFIVCGVGTAVNSGSGGGTANILVMSGGSPTSQIDSAQVGKTFDIWGPSGITNCGAGSSFKGLANTASNTGTKTMPTTMTGLNGTRAGPTNSTMYGPNGCSAGDDGSSNWNCVVLLPVCTTASSMTFSCVAWAPFLLVKTATNRAKGTLLDSYTMAGATNRSYTWTYGSKGAISIGLTG